MHGATVMLLLGGSFLLLATVSGGAPTHVSRSAIARPRVNDVTTDVRPSMLRLRGGGTEEQSEWLVAGSPVLTLAAADAMASAAIEEASARKFNDVSVTVLDATGAHVAELSSRRMRADLPLILGEGADKNVDEALALFAAAQLLSDRVRGLLRVGERRWDLMLDREQKILLPPKQPIQALQRVIALNQVHDLLARDVALVDMRIGERPTLRMTKHAVGEWREIRQQNNGG